MNTRARVKAIPVLVAASLGIGTFAGLDKMMAHEGHVTSMLQPSGFPELALTVEEAGVTGMPESVEAGRYLVKVTGPEPGEMGPSGAVFAQFPEGVTPESAFEDLMAAQGAAPEWFLDAHWGGGVVLSQGTESWGVIDFTPGSWVTTTPFGGTLAIAFEVTGEMPADLPATEANVTLELAEMTIRVADGAFVAGDNVVTVTNAGAQIHFVDFMQLPDGTTTEQVEAFMDSMMTGTPPAGDDALAEEDAVPVAYLADISGGVQQTLPLNLGAGTYFLTCWVPDLETGMPHAMMGMWTVITVE